ncbi:hypothetical protein [Halospeciosus flavus]|uniref:Uncharacterized protein n=1 Tax=Halospeciosus flavus TaxID=3032283 RepID=A0ABD5Z2C1_9EURY|nr:hypothetical protein [Halospeciosus flavus]
MPTSRRALLAALAAGSSSLSGCASLFDLFAGGPSGEGPRSNDGPGRTTRPAETTVHPTPDDPPADGEWPDPPTDERHRTHSVTTLEPAGRTLSLFDTTFSVREQSRGPFRDGDRGGRVAVAAAFVRSATDEHPALLRVTLRADWRPAFGPDTRTLDLGRVPLFDGHEFGPYVLAPTANHDLVDADDVPEDERGPNGGWRLKWAPDSWLPTRVDVARRERIHGEYRVLRGILDTAPLETFRTPLASPNGGDWNGDPLLSLVSWETGAPGPDGRSRFHGQSVDPLPGSMETVWYHDLDPTASLFLRPATERADLPARLRFSLVNHSLSTLRLPGTLAVHKRHAEAWYPIAPWGPSRWVTPAFVSGTPPGDVHQVERAVFADEGFATGIPSTTYLGAGTYAFSLEIGDDGDEGANADDAVTKGESVPNRRVAALVELTGETVSVVPQTGVSTTREGSTVTVRTQVAGTDTVTAVVERADDADRVVLAEQVMHGENDVLRNSLPFFEPGVERVRVVTTPGVVATAVGGKPPARFRYRGSAFSLSVEQ